MKNKGSEKPVFSFASLAAVSWNRYMYPRTGYPTHLSQCERGPWDPTMNEVFNEWMNLVSS